jgi:hypothetical protein
MASERQIAANRRNASKSAGPRSQAGKSRASRNAYRHGLSRSISTNTAFAKQVETLAQEIAGDSDDGSVLDCARAVAEAELDLERIRQTKVALIERVRAFGGLERPEICRSVTQIARFLKARGIFIPPKVIDPLATIPSEEPARTMPCDACYQNCSSSTDMNGAPLPGVKVHCDASAEPSLKQLKVAILQSKPIFSCDSHVRCRTQSDNPEALNIRGVTMPAKPIIPPHKTHLF